MILFILIFMLGFHLGKSDPCTNYSELPFADLRFVHNVYDSTEEAVNDRYLTAGWYRVGDEDMPVTKPNFLSCGTKSPIWLNGTIPQVSSNEVSMTACVVVGGSGCVKTYDIKVKSCKGDYRVYYLVSTLSSNEGYCFGTGEAGQKPTYTPKMANVSVRIIPHLTLKAYAADCMFEKSPGPAELFYQVTWYIDGVYLTAMEPKLFSDIFHIVLNETNMKTLGRNVSCSVRAKMTPKGPLGPSVRSAEKFFGIEVLTPQLQIERGKTGTIRLRPTVPIGCLPDGDNCDLLVALYSEQPKDDCNHITTFKQTDCGAVIKTENWFDIIEISVAVDEEDGHDKFDDLIDVVLRTDDYDYHSIWKYYKLPIIKVRMKDTFGLDNGACEANNDPHMLTFDHRPYDIQYKGDFIMYRNTEYPIQVQTRFQSCKKNGRAPFCVLGVAVQAGRDLFVIDKSQHYADFVVCDESALDVRQVNPRLYRIYTPIGSMVEVTIAGSHITVHIYPSVRDKTKTEGLCGTLTNTCNDDFKMSDKTWLNDFNTNKNCGKLGRTDYRFKPKRFSDSWLVSNVPGAVNLFNLSIDVTSLLPWEQQYRRCKCYPSGKEKTVINCSLSMVSTCRRDRVSGGTVNTCKVHQSSKETRSKRSLKTNQLEREKYHQRKKKSAPSTILQMTEAEAEAYCQSTLGNSELFKLCGDVPNVNNQHAMQACVMDIMLSNTTDWTDSSREALQHRCLSELELNTTLEKNGIAGQPSIAAAIRKIACPMNCTGAGICVNGTCDCQNGFGGVDCSIDLSVPPYFHELLDDGMCDKQGWECDVAMAIGDDFIAKGHLRCKMEPFWHDTNGELHTESDEIVTADIQTFMNLFCPLTMVRRKRDTTSEHVNKTTFVEGYQISLSNDGIHFGDKHTLFIYDSQCQTETLTEGKKAFSLKDGYCFIDNKCTNENDINPIDVCQTCNPKVAPYKWSASTMMAGCIPVESENDDGNYLWVIGVVAGVLAAWVVIGVVVWKIHVRKLKKVTDSTFFVDTLRTEQHR